MDRSRNRPRDYTLGDVLAVAPGYTTLKDLSEGLNLANSSAHHYWNLMGWLEKIKGALASNESRSPSVLAQAEDAGSSRQLDIDLWESSLKAEARDEEYDVSAPQTLVADEIDYYEDLVKYKNSEVSRLQGQVRKLRGQLYDRDVETQMVGEVIEAAVERHRAKNPECIKYVARSKTREDWVCLAPVADLHSGLYVWGAEGWGRNYDTDEACRRLEEHGREVSDWIRSQGGTCLKVYMPDVGDILHAIDGQTQHGTLLHQDTRGKRVFDMTIDARLAGIEEVRKACEEIHVYNAPGNHDHDWNHALSRAVAEHYRDADDVVVEHFPTRNTHFVEGECLHFFDHGYGINRLSTPSAITKMRLTVEQAVPEVAPGNSGPIKYVYFYCGHLHHEERKADGIFDFRRLPAMCESDEYAERLRVTSKPGAVAFRLNPDGYISESRNIYFG